MKTYLKKMNNLLCNLNYLIYFCKPFYGENQKLQYRIYRFKNGKHEFIFDVKQEFFNLFDTEQEFDKADLKVKAMLDKHSTF